jgi:hypothetical protein
VLRESPEKGGGRCADSVRQAAAAPGISRARSGSQQSPNLLERLCAEPLIDYGSPALTQTNHFTRTTQNIAMRPLHWQRVRAANALTRQPGLHTQGQPTLIQSDNPTPPPTSKGSHPSVAVHQHEPLTQHRRLRVGAGPQVARHTLALVGELGRVGPQPAAQRGHVLAPQDVPHRARAVVAEGARVGRCR